MSDDQRRNDPFYWDARDYSKAAQAYLSIEAVNRPATVDQESFGFGDPGTEAGHALDAQNADRTVEGDGGGNYKFFLRWLIVQTLTNANTNLTNTFKLQYRRTPSGGSPGAWTDVTASSSHVRVVDDTNITDGAATTSRLTAGTGVPIPGWYDEGDGVWPALTWDPATNNREEANFLSSLEVVDADMGDGDVLDFRVLHSDDTLLDVYTVADATLTWQAAAAGSETLVIADATHGHTAEAPALVEAALLTVADATHGHTADAPALVQANLLTVADSSHAHAADNIDLSLGSVGLIVEDGSHAHAADNVDLTQAYLLAVDDSLHAHAADNLDLTQAAILAVADASHGHSADNIVFNIGGVTLVVADALHGHTADNVDLLPANVLAVADGLHGHTADNVDLTQAYLLAIDDALHAHEAENLILDLSVQLIIQDALHGHSADTLALLQASTLTVADALHGHSSGNVVLVLGDGPLEIADALHGHTADGLTLSTGIVLVVADAAHGHTADSLALVQGYALLVDDGVHGHTADSLGLLQANVLTVADALHLHTADGPVLVAVGNPVELPNPLTARWAIAKRTASLLVANRTASWIQE